MRVIFLDCEEMETIREKDFGSVAEAKTFLEMLDDMQLVFDTVEYDIADKFYNMENDVFEVMVEQRGA